MTKVMTMNKKMSRRERKIRRTIVLSVVAVLAIIVACLLIAGTVKATKLVYSTLTYELNDQTEFDKMLTYGKHRISYNSLNVRAEPSTDAEIIDELTLGEYVYFSGNTFRHGFSLCEDHPYWVELKDGGWIIYSGFLDDDAFRYTFGY